MISKNKILLCGRILLISILFGILFKLINVRDFITILKEAKIQYLIAAGLLWPAGLALNSLKWTLILRKYGIPITYKESFNIFWVGSFFNNFLPSGFGGDSYKFISVNKEYNGKKTKILSSIIIDRGINFLSVLLCISCFWFYLNKDFAHNSLVFTLFLLSLIGSITLLSVILFFNNKFHISRDVNNKYLNKTKNLFNSLTSFNDKKSLLISILLSLTFTFLIGLAYLYLFMAFNQQISLLLLLFIIPLTTFTELIPLTINSLGIKEGFATYLFILNQISAEVVLAVFLSGRVINILATATGGIKFLLIKNRNAMFKD